MDYEKILFGLQPILNASTIKDVPMNDVYLGSYLIVIDQLAVSLREPNNRNVVGKTGLLANLVRILEQALDHCLHDENTSDNDRLAFFKIVSELIRCVANAMIDNDDNRDVVLSVGKNILFSYYIGGILKLNQISLDDTDDRLLNDLQMRSVALLRNFCAGGERYMEKIATFIRGPIFSMLKTTQYTYLASSDQVTLGTELLSELLKFHYKNVQISDLFFLSQYIKKISSKVQNIELPPIEDEALVASTEVQQNLANEERDDETNINLALVLDLSTCLETIVAKDEDINFSGEEEVVLNIQKNILASLDCLAPKTFNNKLIVMRRLVSCAGNISANLTTSNKKEQPLCIETIKNSTNSYTLAASLIILSNSIACKADADALMKLVSFGELIQTGSIFKDPVQYQGFLDLTRKLLNLENAMWLDAKDLVALFQTMKNCHEQTKFFSNLLPLLTHLLNKVLTVLPSSKLQSLVSSDRTIITFITEHGTLTCCIAMDKLLVSKTTCSTEVLKPLWDTIFKFQNPGQSEQLSISDLFHITKTVGIYLRNVSEANYASPIENILFMNYIQKLILMLETILSFKNNEDKGSESCFNNGKFIAGMILNLVKGTEYLTPEETKLETLAKLFF
ncbi:hypothetical protein SEUBUCD646_0P01270 [Saccharomyces eubayanus]|uniref:BEM4-like protein n=1 Tax=Saccharomyces eubayanus TaxID=1080349 RepID=A0ABN8VI54_SACEU|nr:hypothetical protein SEUBUCD650_0P01280 [Saccharomyces eubayanus]CAI1787841.1 hypothetical protein SEUBUCD646_0P01270 [Saccharomyces eubayanus]